MATKEYKAIFVKEKTHQKLKELAVKKKMTLDEIIIWFLALV